MLLSVFDEAFITGLGDTPLSEMLNIINSIDVYINLAGHDALRALLRHKLRTAPRYLDIESIVVLGEEFASRLTQS